jgi:DGQHR domain-containing protein
MYRESTMAGVANQAIADKFEERVLDLLKKLGLKHINGGPNFQIGGHQTDACGGYQGTLFIIESTTQKGSIRVKINSLRGQISAINKDIEQDPNLRNYDKIVYIIAVKQKEISQSDTDLASQSPNTIHLLNETAIEYYETLASTIGEWSKFTFLSDLKISPVPEDELKIPTFRVEINGKIVYNFFVEAEKLLKFCYVARREAGKEDYYQRVLTKNRLADIAKFVENGGMFANNIILGIEKKSRFEVVGYVKDSMTNWPKGIQFGILTLPHNYNTCWVIDGQHRLFSFCKTKNKLIVPVTAFDNLEKEKQAEFFIDINKEAKPVQPDLLWDLIGDLRPESEDGIISKVVKELNNDDPLKGMLYIPKYGSKKTGQLKFSGVCSSIQKRKLIRDRTEKGEGNPLFSENKEKLIANASNSLSKYFQKVKEVFKDNWELGNKGFVVSNGGISVMITIYERFLSLNSKVPTDENLTKYLTTMRNYIESDFNSPIKLKKLRERTASEAGKTELAKEFIFELSKIYPEFKKHVDSVTYHQSVVDFEIKFRNFVGKVLGNVSDNWLKQRVSSDIYERAKRKADERGSTDILNYLTLGDCKEIIKREDNKKIFIEILTKPPEGFDDFAEFIVAFDKISKARNDLLHRNDDKVTKDEVFKAYFYKMDKVLEGLK